MRALARRPGRAGGARGLLALVALALPALGQSSFQLEQKLVDAGHDFPSARYGQASEPNFGEGVLVSGDHAAVGITGFRSIGGGRARVEMLERSGGRWIPATQIRTFGDQPSSSIRFDLEGDTLVIGDPFHRVGGVEQVGAVFAYRRDSFSGAWEQVARIDTSSPTINGRFGVALSLSGDTLMVSASGEDDVGAIQLFERDLGGPDAWGLRQRITPPAGSTEFLGLALAGDLLAALNRESTTSAFLKVRERAGGPGNPFQETASLPLGFVGIVTAVAEDATILLTPLQLGSSNPSVRIFEKDVGGWLERPPLQQPVTPTVHFSVASLQGNTFLATAFQEFRGAQTAGVYLYERDAQSPSGWTLQEVVTAPDAQYGYQYAAGASLSGDTLFVSALQASMAGPHAGEVYVYRRVP